MVRRPNEKEPAMSAWLCSEYHINAIVNAVAGTEKDFKMLVKENLRSLGARYPGRDFLAEWKADARVYKFCPTAPAVSLTQLVKACDCYDYQACETDDYKSTAAAAFVAIVREDALRNGGKSEGPEWDAAEWGL